MRVIAIIIAILGLAVFVYGILFVAQAGTLENQVANEITPLTLGQLDAKYDEVKASFDKFMASEGPKIGQAGYPTAMYDYVSAQRALLGLSKTNVGMAKLIRTSGTVDILVGLGLFLGGVWTLRKSMSAA